MSFLDIAATLSIGLLIGNEFAVSAFINPVLRQLDERAQSASIRLFAVRLGKAMPGWYAVSFVLLLLETFVRRHQAGFPLLVAASVLWGAVILLTIIFLAPINGRLAQLQSGVFSKESLREHRLWDTRHRLRVFVLAVAMVTFLLAIPR